MPKEIYASLGNMVALLVEWDIRLLALRSQGQTTLLQLRLGVVPVLVQNELLQHTTHTCDQTISLHPLISKNQKQ